VLWNLSFFFFFNGLNFPDIQLTHKAHPSVIGYQVPSSASGCVKFRLDLTMLSKVEYGEQQTHDELKLGSPCDASSTAILKSKLVGFRT
jgi:hypothetical protein